MTASNGEHAVALAANGWPVFLLAPRSKVPLEAGGHGHLDGSTDLALTERRWKLHPHANIGARVPDSLVCIDLDPRNGAVETLSALVAAHGRLPATLTSLTGSGGAHMFYARPPGELTQRSNLLGAGIDVKVGGRGYVVLPPSIHPNGRRYCWAAELTEVAPMPAWMVHKLRPPPARPKRKASTVTVDGDSFEAIAAAYNARARWADILEPHGWTHWRTRGENQHWTRPGETGRTSATINEGRRRRALCVQHRRRPGRQPRLFQVRRLHHPEPRRRLRRGDRRSESDVVYSVTEFDLSSVIAPSVPAGHNGSGAEVVQLPPTGFFTEKGALVVPQLAEVVQQAGHPRTGVDGRLYRYDRGVYLPDGDIYARGRVRELLADRCQRKHFDEVLTWLRSFEATVTADPPTSMLNVANGLLDWRSGELRPHDPGVVSTVQSPVSWDPSAACPAFDRFISEVVPADAVDLILEVAAYVLYPGNPLRQAVLLLGPGRNGKSVLLGALRALVGDRNVSAVPLQALAENRFAAAELFGKLANISGDLDARAIRNTDLFKMATGNDAILAERKYGAAFSFVPFTTFVFAANEAPISSDQTDAWFDRWLVVPFDNRIPDERVDPHLLARLTTPQELSGLLAKAVPALRRLLARGRFAVPPSVEAAGERYRDKLDTVRGFVTEHCTVHADAWVARPRLYRSYRTWAGDSGRLPVSVEKFNEHLRRAYPVSETVRRGSRGWSGIGLGAEEEGP